MLSKIRRSQGTHHLLDKPVPSTFDEKKNYTFPISVIGLDRIGFGAWNISIPQSNASDKTSGWHSMQPLLCFAQHFPIEHEHWCSRRLEQGEERERAAGKEVRNNLGEEKIHAAFPPSAGTTPFQTLNVPAQQRGRLSNQPVCACTCAVTPCVVIIPHIRNRRNRGGGNCRTWVGKCRPLWAAPSCPGGGNSTIESVWRNQEKKQQLRKLIKKLTSCVTVVARICVSVDTKNATRSAKKGTPHTVPVHPLTGSEVRLFDPNFVEGLCHSHDGAIDGRSHG